jgi:DNA-binding LacI/PurR family transcriptional regulator
VGGLLYRRIQQDLSARIRRGELPVGSVVPSEHQLCAQYGVSVTTARRALSELTRQGLVYRHAGLGSFVADPGRDKRLSLVFAGFDPSQWRTGSYAMGELVGGVSEVAWRRECALDLTRIDEPLDTAILQHLISQRDTHGLLLRVPENIEEEHIALLEASAFPYVFVRRYHPTRPANAVAPDDAVGVRLGLAHLAHLGHRRIGLLAAMPDMVLTRDRLRGYLAAVAALGLERGDGLIRLAHHYGADEGHDLAAALLSQPGNQRPSAVIVNAALAPGLYDAAAELGLAIPGDLAVIGFDDTLESRSLRPRLTCVRTGHYEIAQAAAELLLDLILGRVRGPRHLFVEPVLNVQDSTVTREDGAFALPSAGAPVGRSVAW